MVSVNKIFHRNKYPNSINKPSKQTILLQYIQANYSTKSTVKRIKMASKDFQTFCLNGKA